MDSKRRIESGLTSSNKKLKSNNLEEDSTSDDAGEQQLESFRKAAIWREMLEYKRKFLRAQSTLEEFEQERNKCDARLSVVEISWKLLVAEADLVLPSTSTLSNGHSHDGLPSITDPNLSSEELQDALLQRSSATKNLLKRLGELHPSERGDEADAKVIELQSQCQTILQQSLESQESLRLLQAQHEFTMSQLETTRTELLRAEKQFDRLQSATVQGLDAAPTRNGSHPGSSTPVGIKQSPKSPAPLLDSPKPEVTAIDINTGVMLTELEDLRALVETRGRDIEELSAARLILEKESALLKLSLTSIPEEIIMETHPFKILQGHVQHMSVDLDSKRLELEKIVTESNDWRENQLAFKDEVFRESEEQVSEMQKKLTLKESDLTRIRTQREEFRSELTELKVKESDKMKSLEQLKTLATSREDRIGSLTSEIRRLKMRVSAHDGDSVTVDLLGLGEEEDIIKDLQSRLKTAEDLLLALGSQLQSYSTTSTTGNGPSLVESETNARKELNVCRERLSKLEALLGPDGNVELAQLTEKLFEREEKDKVLEAKIKSQDHATNMLYGEIDRLSAAWATLDEQNSAKVFNLVNLEEKVQRLNTEKAKADNRYFATMRQKDSIVNENLVLTKLVEKQQKAVEAANDVKHSVGTQVTAVEKEISSHIQLVRVHREKIAELSRENNELILRNQANSKHIVDLNVVLAERIAAAETEMNSRKKIEEQLTRVGRELRDAKVSTRSMTSSIGQDGDTEEVRELRKYNDDLSKMLKCSTCNLRFKGVIINRCSHLFCKECIEARLSNRARKCPTCQTPFGRDDVSPVYF